LLVITTGCGLFDSDDGDGPTGFAGVGDECTSDEQCRERLKCEAESETCQPKGTVLEGGPCILTGDCQDGLYCGPRRTCVAAGGRAQGEPCTSTAQCKAGLVCSLDAFFARCSTPGDGDRGDSCTREVDCLAGLACMNDPESGMKQCTDPPRMEGNEQPPPRLPSWDGELCQQDDGSPRAYFEVPQGNDADRDFYRLPFPNDIRRTESGLDLSGYPTPGDAVPTDVLGRYVEASEQDLNGFATNPVVYFRFSKPHDWGTTGGRFKLINIDPDSDAFGQQFGSVGWLNTSGRISKYICPNWLAVRPNHGAPLKPGTTYAVVLEKGIKTDGGETFQTDSDFEAMLADSAPDDATLAEAWEAYAPLRQWLTESGTDPSTLLNAAVFTTQKPETKVAELRQVIRERSAPSVSELTVCEQGVTSPCDDGTEQRSCGSAHDAFTEIHGKIELPIFQQGTPPYRTPEQGGGIQTGEGGLPEVARTEEVCFAMTVPKSDEMPTEGYPVMLYLHGTGGSFRGAVRNGLAAEMAAAQVPSATLGIDLPQHGARRGDSNRSPETLFFNFANPRAARDNVLQGSADLMSLTYFAETFSQSADQSPTGNPLALHPGRITLFAHSQGATHASLALPYEPMILAAVLSGNGGDLTQSLLNKTEPVDIASIVPFALMDANSEGKLVAGNFHPALALLQQYFERADTVNYADRLHRNPVQGDPGRHVFMTYGLGDSYSPEPTIKAYARAARLTLVEPVLTTDGSGNPDTLGLPTAAAPLSENRTVGDRSYTIGMRQYEPNEDEDGHFVSTRTESGRADTLRFLRQALAGSPPSIGAAQ
jgi:pimeloyl-ACP methyl ester carboxylesterase